MLTIQNILEEVDNVFIDEILIVVQGSNLRNCKLDPSGRISMSKAAYRIKNHLPSNTKEVKILVSPFLAAQESATIVNKIIRMKLKRINSINIIATFPALQPDGCTGDLMRIIDDLAVTTETLIIITSREHAERLPRLIAELYFKRKDIPLSLKVSQGNVISLRLGSEEVSYV